MLDDEIEGGLANIRLEGLQHDHQKQMVKARLFGGELPQRRIGRFLVRGELGRGGMGTVLEAHDEQLGRAVAIKLVKDGLRAKHHERLCREAQALARLSHPNVVAVHEVGIVDGQMFIVMELVRGITLERWQRQRHAWYERLDAYRKAGRGLAAAHAAGLVHRDFKPSNCIIDDKGRVRVLDFGLARELDDDEDESEPATHDSGSGAGSTEPGARPGDSSGARRRRLTGTGTLLGTRAYMAPEQLHRRVTDARSDQFSFCVALYEALYGQPPFSDDLGMTEGTPHPPSPPPRGSKVPRWLRRAVWRGLSVRPDDRWPAMDALLHELDHGQRRAQLNRASSVSAALVCLVLAGIVALPPHPSPPVACQAAVHGLDGIWDAAQRQKLGDAMLATGHPRAAHTWSVVGRELDRYAADWAETYTRACEATRVHREQPFEILDLRERCLLQRRIALRHHVELLATGDRQRVDDAVMLVTGLPPVEQCMDVEALAREAGELPPEIEREADALRGALEHVRALDLVGQHDAGLEAIEPLLQRAEELGHPPLLAEALQLAGQLHVNVGDDEQAEQRFERALSNALPHEAALEPAIRAMAGSIHLLGVEREKADEALVLGFVAEGFAARPGLDPSLRAEVLTTMAQVQTSQGEYSEAERRYLQAIQILEEQRGEDHIALAEALDGWATAADRQGDRARAEDLYRRALAIREQWLGLDHPAVAYQLANLVAVVVADEGRRLEALELVERAVRILDDDHTPDHKRIAHARLNLGVILIKLDRHSEAEKQLRHAIEHWHLAGQVKHSRMATARFTLARALEWQGRIAEALEELGGAQQILDEVEPTPTSEALKTKVRTRVDRLLSERGAEPVPSVPSGKP